MRTRDALRDPWINALGTIPDVDNWRLTRDRVGHRATKGLQKYLDTVFGKRKLHFSALELGEPYRSMEKAKELGYRNLIPHRNRFQRIALLVWLAEECRSGNPVRVAHLWRPEDVNKACKARPTSQHVNCYAIDLDFGSLRDRNYALNEVLHPLYNSPVHWGLGLGVGARRIHIDLFSMASEAKGGEPRWWRYDSAPKYEGPGRLAR